MSLKVQVVPVTQYQQNCSVIQCQASGLAAIVDPGGDIERIEAAITKMDATVCLLYTSPSPRDRQKSRMPSSA